MKNPHQEQRRRDMRQYERMKRAHEAATYDDWLRTKVAVSLVGIEQGTNRRIEPDKWAQIRAGKRPAAWPRQDIMERL